VFCAKQSFNPVFLYLNRLLRQKERCLAMTGWIVVGKIEIKIEVEVAGCGLRVEGYGLRVAGCGLRVEGYGLRVTGCGLRVAG